MCKVEELKVELESAYSKIRFLEHKVIEANAKVDRISRQKLDSMLESQRPSSLKAGLGYIRESSTDGFKSIKFVSAKISEDKEKNDDSLDEKKRKELALKTPKVKEIASTLIGKGKAMTKSLPKKLRDPQNPYLCHHYGARGHTKPNCFKLHALKNNDPPYANPSLSKNYGLLKQVVDVLLSVDTHLFYSSNSYGNSKLNLTPHGTPSHRGHPN